MKKTEVIERENRQSRLKAIGQCRRRDQARDNI